VPTYVSLINWTGKGVQTVQETLDRPDRIQEIAQKHAASFEQIYGRLGPYDIVTILDAPDDGSATALLLEAATWARFVV